MPNSRLAPYLLCSLLALYSQADVASDIGVLLKKGDAKAALERSDAALIKSPRDVRVRFLRAIALAEQARTPEAIQAFQALTVDHPEMPEPYNNLAVLYAQQGELDKARAALQKAIQTNPAYATAQANLADVYGKLASQAYDKALPVDKNAAAVSPAPARLALVKDLYVGTRNTVVAANTPPSKPALPPSTTPVVEQPKPQTPVPAVTKPTQIAAATPKVEPPAKAMEVKPAPQPQPQPKIVENKPVAPPVPAKPQEIKTAQVPATPVKPTEIKPVEAKPAPAQPGASQAEEEQIAKALHNWAEAWSSKHMGAYLGFYAKSFKPPQGLTRSTWEKQRRERIEAAKKIDVKLSNIKINLDGETATVRLVQRYRSDRMDSSTGKTFLLERIGGHWLIREERVG